jgi:hypothetical protein
MNPTWPERIDSGHTQERLEDGRETGLYQSRFAAGFWPGGWPENSAPCWPCTLASLPRRADSAILEPCHFRMGPVAIVQSSKDLARLLCLFPFCTLHGWLLSCENVLDITDTKALAWHRSYVWTCWKNLPSCPYRKFAQYTGGPVGREDAASFTCVAPSD